MKYFSKLAALLLGAAMIFGFAGCANSSNSTDSDSSENVVYTVKNDSSKEQTISYKNKSNEWVNEQIVPIGGIYEIPASDAKIDRRTYSTEEMVSGIYFKYTNSSVSEPHIIFVPETLLKEGEIGFVTLFGFFGMPIE